MRRTRARVDRNQAEIVAAFQPRRSKYGNRKTAVDGITFDSAKEARRYQELRLLEKAGEITSLSGQVRFDLAVNGITIGAYVADFTYWHTGQEQLVVEDTKGVRTPLYRWKRKHVQAQYGIQILET